MTEVSDGLTQADKVNRLFEVFHARDESEESVDSVAAAVSGIIGRQVTAGQIRALRTNGDADVRADVIDGLVQHFGIPAGYLVSNGPQTTRIDEQLRLLAAMRNAGAKRLALRGKCSAMALSELLRSIGQHRTL